MWSLSQIKHASGTSLRLDFSYLLRELNCIMGKILLILLATISFGVEGRANSYQQTGSGNIIGDNNTVNMAPNGSKVEIPEFVGGIMPIDPKSATQIEYQQSYNFNSFMMANEGRIVFLDVQPFYDDQDLANGYDFFGEKTVFTVSEPEYGDGYRAGCEYIIEGGAEHDVMIDGRPVSRRIKGYFSIVGFSGPHQGYFSTILVPVSLKDVMLLQK